MIQIPVIQRGVSGDGRMGWESLPALMSVVEEEKEIASMALSSPRPTACNGWNGGKGADEGAWACLTSWLYTNLFEHDQGLAL